MTKIRKVESTHHWHSTSDGAGVLLRRVFGFDETGLLDPFLLLDFFGSDNPKDYIAGFPWHPHRGMETITYMIDGEVEHADSIGNKGMIRSGGIQWMTAASGIIHQEMPRRYEGMMRGFQLWLNMPAKDKMTAPKYQEFPAEMIPVAEPGDGIRVKVIAGEFCDTRGPVKDLEIDPLYLDITVPEKAALKTIVNPGHTVFAFVFEGEGFFDENVSGFTKTGTLVKLADGDMISITTKESMVRFLLVAGKPINEPVAWRGPIVMNTQDELATAFREFREGTFVKQ